MSREFRVARCGLRVYLNKPIVALNFADDHPVERDKHVSSLQKT